VYASTDSEEKSDATLTSSLLGDLMSAAKTFEERKLQAQEEMEDATIEFSMGGSTMKVRMYSTTEINDAFGTEMQGLASQLMKQLNDDAESGDVHSVEVQTIESDQIGNLLAKMLSSSDPSLASDDAETASAEEADAQAQNIKVFKQLFAQAMPTNSDDESADVR
jgi:hypothetical protein